MKLFHTPMTRSARVLWLLHELGVPFELSLVDVFSGGGRTPEHRAVHPHGFVPALEVDGEVLLESAGICLWLADRFADRGLAPALSSPARGKYCQWMAYVPATCDPSLETIMFHTRFLPEAKRIPTLVEKARKHWATCERTLAAGLASKPYLLGDTFTAADVLAGSTLGWARMAGVLGDDAALLAYLARVSDRPAFVAAHS